ncbi:MAG: hypothetical protein ACI4PX_06720, partial [Ruminococcus sp.]
MSIGMLNIIGRKLHKVSNLNLCNSTNKNYLSFLSLGLKLKIIMPIMKRITPQHIVNGLDLP